MSERAASVVIVDPLLPTAQPSEPSPSTADAGLAEPIDSNRPAPAPARAARRGAALGFGRAAGGIAAIGVKELRGRMRGRRAFVILTIYLVLLGGFSLMV